MKPERIPGITLILGSVLFIIAAFMPVSRLYAERNPQAKLAIIRAETTAWNISMVLFGLGAAVMVIGLLLWALRLRVTGSSPLIFVAVAAAAIGALLWGWHVYLRVIRPEDFTIGTLPSWMFPLYSVLTQLALLITGIILLRSQYPRWLGFTNIGAAILFAVLYAVFRDVPPFVYYVITLINGIVLML